ncbi:MAG TPA: hypothetical protein VGH38_25895 [Bryobacteraceae bacterium]|jgi:hypothetical protein
MKNIGQFVLCLLVLRGAVPAAQTRISVRLEPKPERIIHVTTSQEFSMALNGGASTDALAGSQIVTETVLGYAQANGHFDDQGRMESQLTIERIDMKQSLNGTAKSPANLDQFVGRSMTAVFDRAGKLVDVKVPKDMQPASTVLKQLVAGANGATNYLPAAEMSVGETETSPSTIPLRLPGSATPTPYQTRTVTTLRAVEKSGSDRVARFDQRIDSAGETDSLKVKGTGTIDVNLDRGYVTASSTEWSFSGESTMSGSAPASQRGAVRGVMRVKVTAHE